LDVDAVVEAEGPAEDAGGAAGISPTAKTV